MRQLYQLCPRRRWGILTIVDIDVRRSHRLTMSYDLARRSAAQRLARSARRRSIRSLRSQKRSRRARQGVPRRLAAGAEHPSPNSLRALTSSSPTPSSPNEQGSDPPRVASRHSSWRPSALVVAEGRAPGCGVAITTLARVRTTRVDSLSRYLRPGPTTFPASSSHSICPPSGIGGGAILGPEYRGGGVTGPEELLPATLRT